MHSRIAKRIYRYYFRVLGLSCWSSKQWLQICLILYTCLILFVEFHEIAIGLITDFNGTKLSIAGSVLFYITLGYNAVHFFNCLIALIGQKYEETIEKIFQDIDDTFQLRLFYQSTHEEEKRLQSDNYFRYYWIFEGFWLLTLIIDAFYEGRFAELLFHARYIFAVQGVTSNYLQQLMVVVEIENKLKVLSHCLVKHNLLFKEKLYPFENNRNLLKTYEVMNADFIEVKKANNDSKEFSSRIGPYQLKRILAMKHVYTQLTKVCQLSSTMYGSRLFLTVLLCIYDFTLVLYFLIIALTDRAVDAWLTFWSFYTNLPSIVKFAFLCKKCESCSSMTSDILLKLRSSPVKSLLVDDFILQIRQNPIKFTAYDFYELNTETLTQVSVIVFDLMLFLVQMFYLTNEP
uniref:Gustatory receptor n=1 Tax=Stomoxys calcitrans TaxID=35570 RepID=A0A905ST59_STOCA